VAIELKLKVMIKRNLFYFLIFISILVQSKDSFSQNVTIGTNSTFRAVLEVNGAAAGGATSAIFGGEGTGISFQRNSPTIGYNQYNASVGKYIGTGFAAIQYLDPGNGRMNFDMFSYGSPDLNTSLPIRGLSVWPNGNIGIKSNGSANASLFVERGTNFNGAAFFPGTNYNSHFYFSSSEHTYIRGGKPNSNVYINDNVPNSKLVIGNGNTLVGINSGDPQYPLEIWQTGLRGLILVEPAESYNRWEQVVGFYNGGPSSSLKMIYNDNFSSFFRPDNGNVVAVSDKRLKINTRSLSPVLDKILQLRPVTYQMKYNESPEIIIGFIAQDVKKIFPEMVSVFPNDIAKDVTFTDFHALNYGSFKILGVKAVQEEQQLITDLKYQQLDITKRLELIEKKLAIKDLE
jgi:hypothetical protein